MSVSAAVLDRKPETEDERAIILDVVMAQSRELAACEAKVTCPCGWRAPVVFAFHCYHCGIAGRHFGEPT